MKILMVLNGFDTDLFMQLGELFSKQGDEVRYIEFEQDKFEDYFLLPNEIVRYGPHVIQSSVSRFPLLICQIVCGIPTVVQVQDDFEQLYRDMIYMDPRISTTHRMLQSFVTSGASAVVTSHKEIVKGMRAQNPMVEYIPRPREIRFLDYGRQDGYIGLLGDFKGIFSDIGLPDGLEFIQLKKKDLSSGREGSRFSFIAVAPGYELDRRTSERLCLWGAPVARPSRGDLDIDDGMPFYEYSMEDYPGSLIALWDFISKIDPSAYEHVIQSHKDVMEAFTIDSVGAAYKELYDVVIRKAMLHTPVRGW